MFLFGSFQFEYTHPYITVLPAKVVKVTRSNNYISLFNASSDFHQKRIELPSKNSDFEFDRFYIHNSTEWQKRELSHLDFSKFNMNNNNRLP